MYAKVFTQMYDGTLCTRGPWQSLVTFQQLLVLADQDGNVDMTAEAIARRTTIPLDIIKLGIETLLLEDKDSRTPTENGKRIIPLSDGRDWGWHVVNYKHYRALKREEDRREYHREYWHKRKLNNTQHPQPNQPIAEAEAEANTEEEKKEYKARGRAMNCPEDVSEEVFNDWKAQRKAKKSAVSKIVVEGIRREASIAGMTLQQAMVIQIERGWQGFKAEWLRDTHKASGTSREAEARRRMQQAVPNVADWSDNCPMQATDFFEAEARIVNNEPKRISK